MNRLRILFFQADYSRYHSAHYQHAFFMALDEVHEVVPYGPGHPGYASEHTIQDVLGICPFDPDLICFGAGWERDDHPSQFNVHPRISVANLGIPSVMMLNKEYKKLDQKFEFIRENGIQIVFTPHHKFAQWSEELGVTFLHFPFAVCSDLFRDYGEEKRYDFGFAGSLHEKWISVRLDVKRKIFWYGRVKWPRYWFKRVYWGEWDNGLKTGEDYARLINSSRIWLATTSAVDLVGTRFYEIMAVQTLLFCNRSSVYDGLFEDGKHCVMFEPDLSDFDDKLFYYMKHEDECKAIVEQAYHHVIRNHTWNERVRQFTTAVRPLLRR